MKTLLLLMIILYEIVSQIIEPNSMDIIDIKKGKILTAGTSDYYKLTIPVKITSIIKYSYYLM